ncbi:hypothetical protein Tco_0047718 [Tanacetum coccineum]
MDDPNITMEEYIKLEEEKVQRQGRTFNWQTAKYGKMEYYKNEDDGFMDFETEYSTIVLDDAFDTALSCEPTVDGYDEGVIHSYEQRLEMIWGRPVNRYIPWRRLFEVMGPLVREFILEFLSTCKMSDTEMGLDVADTLMFFTLELGERLGGKISVDRDFLGPALSYVHIRDPMRRLCHRMIVCSISGRGQGAEKVTGVGLFYFQTMDRGTANVPYLLAQYLFHHAEGRKSGARLYRADEGAQAVPALVQAPQPPPPAPQPRTMSQRIDRLEEEAFDSTLVGSSQLSYERRVRPRIGDASTFISPQTDDQSDP